ncbi:hypothetical protein AB6A40_002353 [Gnathostoma spinigerum]|uniref:Uncharacterized protein n=1 Tax=Gnathostoma spinigerum TaxID=75299 RepID=A0ABD6E6C3_9BILA
MRSPQTLRVLVLFTCLCAYVGSQQIYETAFGLIPAYRLGGFDGWKRPPAEQPFHLANKRLSERDLNMLLKGAWVG